MVALTVTGPQQKMNFEYDAGSRRIRKKVWNNTAGSGTPATVLKFVYDRWNLIAELNGKKVVQVRNVRDPSPKILLGRRTN
jgi:hypothetical protein